MPIVVMGVSGSGKSTVAAALAVTLGGVYLDADDLHPAENVAKMSAGTPLTDEDRMPWLRAVGEAMVRETSRGRLAVVACSALRRRYRDVLRETGGDVFFIALEGSAELLTERITVRTEHFMPPTLLASQLALLEPLEADERGAAVSIDAPVDRIVAEARDRWADAEKSGIL
ncbi:gluconokinase [Microbacterium sp. CFBP9034]|uniref:gluconokinase n=1 Tax=Microbacterium sp. CFBP9034 TaxID=3096540 RepID=UPI002A6B50A4|nr:gluconokinase [Microbacterium sp. CFBP9034]MDY0908596.1 gluconokinase [Microbacterium sp. CFBP9034]